MLLYLCGVSGLLYVFVDECVLVVSRGWVLVGGSCFEECHCRARVCEGNVGVDLCRARGVYIVVTEVELHSCGGVNVAG